MLDLNIFAAYPQVSKIWGKEIWLVNNDFYCSKLLSLTPGFRCSLHLHRIKHETFTVLEGAVGVERRGRIHFLAAGESLEILPGTLHRFWSLGPEGALILETSTHHSDADVERLEESGRLEEPF